ncbi:MAG: gliding motility protein RemB [Bacteroidota bacterium]|nr:gliding motility protein RemB [Bacteroidota bacterium]
MRLSLLSLLVFTQGIFAQERTLETPPVFEGCEQLPPKQTELCFYNKVQEFVYHNFKTPESVNSNQKNNFIVVFEVDPQGNFNIIHSNSKYAAINQEIKRVFALLPKITPSTYKGNNAYAKYSLHINIPLEEPSYFDLNQITTESVATKSNRYTDHSSKLNELDSIKYYKFDNPQFRSRLSIPFSHSMYAQFDKHINQLGANNHTAQKPYNYAEVARYYDFEQHYQSISKNKNGWWGRKLWNENLIAIQGENYWFTMNPVLDLRIGKDFKSDLNYTYVNTRGLQIQGALGENIHFSTTIYESQGRFADYYNAYAESIRPSGGNPAVIPGIGIAKSFKTNAYDFPSAEAIITVTPIKFIDLQLGYGRNFIGDGYRSLFHSDGTSTHPFFKINTTFWKIKYTNTYLWLKDIQDANIIERTYASKYMANHYLSWNVSNRLNLGVFESVVWNNSNNRGFDFNFVNPIIFYRTVEFNSSSRSGNALLGLSSKFKINNKINIYGQFLIDEFSMGDVKKRNKSWKNKFGYQIGAKYYDAFGVENLMLQAEYNIVRPYVYSHSDPITNYAHNNQSMGHNWGGNFKELILVGRYFKGRIFADAKMTIGTRGLDFNTPEDNYNYGGNIFLDYDNDRPYDTNVRAGQGNTTKVFIADIQTGYLINPSTNLKLFANITYRNFNPFTETATNFHQETTWFSVGIRSDLFNWYFDY